mmetsp:Transcript_13124/g.21757  ORF Transcript_13124/g.21757 Transcript_13124/m.21757 type:complete len:134 (-) Transcript_13124:95-496(-)
MALPPPPPSEQPESSTSSSTIIESEEEEETRTFHPINWNYPGVKTLHTDPDILEVDHFRTPDECDRPYLIPCVTKHPTTGAVEMDPDRTSTNANIPQSEIPTIVDKLLKLTIRIDLKSVRFYHTHLPAKEGIC